MNNIVIKQPGILGAIKAAGSQTATDASNFLKAEANLILSIFKRVQDAIPVPVVRSIIAFIPAALTTLVLEALTLGLGLLALLIDFIRNLGCDVDCCDEALTVDITDAEESGSESEESDGSFTELPTEIPDLSTDGSLLIN